MDYGLIIWGVGMVVLFLHNWLVYTGGK